MRKLISLLGITVFFVSGCSVYPDAKFNLSDENPTNFSDIKKILSAGEISYIESLQKKHIDEELEIECYMGPNKIEDIVIATDKNKICKGIEKGGRESSMDYIFNDLLAINTRVVPFRGVMNEETIMLLENDIEFSSKPDNYIVSQAFHKTALTLMTGSNQRFKKVASTQSDRAPGLVVLYDHEIPNEMIQEYKASVFPSTVNGYDPEGIDGKKNYDRFCEVRGEPTRTVGDVVNVDDAKYSDDTNPVKPNGCNFTNASSISVINLIASNPQFFVYLTTAEKYSDYIAIKSNFIESEQKTDASMSESLMLANTDTQLFTRSRKLVATSSTKYSRLLSIIDKLLVNDEIHYKVSQKAKATKVYAAKDKVIERIKNIYKKELTQLDLTIKWTSPPYTMHGVTAINDDDDNEMFGPYADILKSITEIYRNVKFEYVDFGSDAYTWEMKVKQALESCTDAKTCALNMALPYISYNPLSVAPDYTETNLGDSIAMNFYSVGTYIDRNISFNSPIYTVENTVYENELKVAGYSNFKKFPTVYETLIAAKKDKAFILGSSDWQTEDLALKLNFKESLTKYPIKMAHVKYSENVAVNNTSDIALQTNIIANTFYELHDNLYIMEEWYSSFDSYLSLKAAKYQDTIDRRTATQTQFFFIVIVAVVIGTIVVVGTNVHAKNKKEKEKLEIIDTAIKSDPAISILQLDFTEKTLHIMRGESLSKLFNKKLLTFKEFLSQFNISHTQFVGMLAAAQSQSRDQQTVITNKDLVKDDPSYFALSSTLTDENKHGTLALKDITEDVKEKARLLEKVEKDELTGLYSRTSYLGKIKEVLSDPMISTGFVAFMDINDFKETNDKYGHKTGDYLLQSFANRLREALGDIEGNILVRISGDEFLVFIPNADEAKAKELCLKTVEVLDVPFEIDTNSGAGIIQIKAKPSVGYAMYGGTTKDVERLVQYADFAMYKAKMKKHIDRLPIHLFNMQEYVRETKVKIEIKFLRDAIQNQSFTSWFQPIVDVKTGKIYGYEALARPLIASLPDIGRCMELADRTWLLKPLTKTLSEVAAKKWQEKGNDRSIFINEPPFLVYNQGENNHILDLINKVGKEKVIIEITEQFSFRPEDLKQKYDELTAAGINIAIDDFGSGHANMLMFETIHPKIVKIDRSLLQNIDKDEKRRNTVKHLIRFITEANILCLAEGVETIEEYKILKEAGVDLVQGYLFGKPNPEVTLVAEERFKLIEQGITPEAEVIKSSVTLIQDQDKETIETMNSANITQEQLEKLEKEAIGFDSYINLKEQNKVIDDLEKHNKN